MLGLPGTEMGLASGASYLCFVLFILVLSFYFDLEAKEYIMPLPVAAGLCDVAYADCLVAFYAVWLLCLLWRWSRSHSDRGGDSSLSLPQRGYRWEFLLVAMGAVQLNHPIDRNSTREVGEEIRHPLGLFLANATYIIDITRSQKSDLLSDFSCKCNKIKNNASSPSCVY